MTAVPAIHDLAKQVGVELPEYFGTFKEGAGGTERSSSSTTETARGPGQSGDGAPS